MMSRSTQQTRLSSVREAAEQLRISPSTIRRDARLGRIRVIRYGRRVLIPASELARIAREGLITHEPEMEVA
jgi:excisionase family DNA binding protein